MSAGLVEAQGFDSAPLDLLKANFNPALPRWPAAMGATAADGRAARVLIPRG
jgi:hypothetical protein